MMSNGSDPASQAAFRAEVQVELRHIFRQIDLLWDHHAKRRAEIEAAETRLAAQIEAIRSRINAGILWAALAAGGLLFEILKPKLGL
jgi:ferric-dicitrate binding protein FerR (iron transport regulator)